MAEILWINITFKIEAACKSKLHCWAIQHPLDPVSKVWTCPGTSVPGLVPGSSCAIQRWPSAFCVTSQRGSASPAMSTTAQPTRATSSHSIQSALPNNPGRNMNGRWPANLPKPNHDNSPTCTNSHPRHPRASPHDICNELWVSTWTAELGTLPGQRISILPTWPRQKKKMPAPKVGSSPQPPPQRLLRAQPQLAFPPGRLVGRPVSTGRQTHVVHTPLVTRGHPSPGPGTDTGVLESPMPGKDSCRTRKAPPTGAAPDDTASCPVLDPLALSPLGDVRPSQTR